MQLRKWIRNLAALEMAAPTSKCQVEEVEQDGSPADNSSSPASPPTIPQSPLDGHQGTGTTRVLAREVSMMVRHGHASHLQQNPRRSIYGPTEPMTMAQSPCFNPHSCSATSVMTTSNGPQHMGMPTSFVTQPQVWSSGIQQPGMQQLGIQQPGMQQLGMQQPGMQQPGMQQPGMQQPGIQQQQPSNQMMFQSIQSFYHATMGAAAMYAHSSPSQYGTVAFPGAGTGTMLTSLAPQHQMQWDGATNLTSPLTSYPTPTPAVALAAQELLHLSGLPEAHSMGQQQQPTVVPATLASPPVNAIVVPPHALHTQVPQHMIAKVSQPQPLPANVVHAPQPMSTNVMMHTTQSMPANISHAPQPMPGSIMQPQAMPANAVHAPQLLPANFSHAPQPKPGSIIQPQALPANVVRAPQPLPTNFSHAPQPMPGSIIQPQAMPANVIHGPQPVLANVSHPPQPMLGSIIQPQAMLANAVPPGLITPQPVMAAQMPAQMPWADVRA